MSVSGLKRVGNSEILVVHLTESGGGVLEYIKKIVETTPEVSHILVMRKRAYFSNLDMSNFKNFQIIEWHGNLFRGIKIALQLYWKNNAQYIHLHSSLAGLARLVPRKIRFVYSPHCYAFERKDISISARLFIYIVEYFLSINTVKYMCVSEREKQLTKKFLNKCPITNVNFPVDEMKPSPPLNYIVAIGRICPQKNPTEFIEIASMVRLKYPEIEFVWIGDGDADLKTQLESNQIQVTGWSEKPRIFDIVSEALAVLHTALWEGMPVIFSEIMASGIPLIVRKSKYLKDFGESYIHEYSNTYEASEWIGAQLKFPNRKDPILFSRDVFANTISKLYEI